MAHKKVYAEGASQKEKDRFEKFLSEDEELDENDFLSLRAKPFYKINDDGYKKDAYQQ